jgi:hypothetical protein
MILWVDEPASLGCEIRVRNPVTAWAEETDNHIKKYYILKIVFTV